MRKLRRLPWRIPKTHRPHPSSDAAIAAPPCEDIERELARERQRDAQPVAFTAGRYVAPVPRSPEIRRKTRHRVTLFPAPAIG